MTLIAMNALCIGRDTSLQFIPLLCDGIGAVCITGDVRINGTEDEGRVEVCQENAWRTVCDNDWNDVDAAVVCIQLGLPFLGKYGIIVLASSICFGKLDPK